MQFPNFLYNIAVALLLLYSTLAISAISQGHIRCLTFIMLNRPLAIVERRYEHSTFVTHSRFDDCLTALHRKAGFRWPSVASMQSFHIESGLRNGVSKPTGLTASDQRGIACQRKMVSDDIGRRSSSVSLLIICRRTLDSASKAPVFRSRSCDVLLNHCCVYAKLEFKLSIPRYSLPLYSTNDWNFDSLAEQILSSYPLLVYTLTSLFAAVRAIQKR